MNDEELLRSAGLILKDSEKQREGITLAAILLFGKDITIMSALPQHKTDAIFRVENIDRYDDRDVMITNLFDTYDRLMEFGRKHLSESFVLEGINSVSARDKILREIFSNLLAHRDYSSAFVAKFVIEKNRMYTENANKAHGIGMLDRSFFEQFPKNPTISKVLRETSLADEPGSGMQNIYKYTKMYSGGIPEFIEGDVFKMIIPLDTISIGKVGPNDKLLVEITNANPQVDPQVDPQVELRKKIISYCSVAHSKKEIAAYCGFKDTKNFASKYLNVLIKQGILEMTIPDKPRSSKQKYLVVTRKK